MKELYSELSGLPVVALLSGGYDSCAVVAFLHRVVGARVHPVFFHYNQSSSVSEDRSASKLCELLGIVGPEFIFLGGLGQSIGDPAKIDLVPARNLFFLTHALQYADARDIDVLSGGFAYSSEGGYPDTSPAFLKSFEICASEAIGYAIRVVAPLANDADKQGAVRLARAAGLEKEIREISHSCYYNEACLGRDVCSGCQRRKLIDVARP